MARSSITTFLAGFDLIAGEWLLDGVSVFPIDDLEKFLAHETVILTGECHALFDLCAVDFDDDFVSNLADQPADVLVNRSRGRRLPRCAL